MAEVTGQIGSEYVELNNAATEATLKDLLKAMKDLSAKRGSGENSSGEVKKFHEELKKSSPVLRNRTKAERQQTQQTLKNKGALAEEVEKRFKASKEIDKNRTTWKQAGLEALHLGTTFANTVNEFANFSDSLTSASSAFSKIPVVGGLLAATFGAIAGNAEKLFASFQSAASVGATFEGSVREMTKTATAAGLTTEQFTGIIAKNGQGLALLGKGAEDGAKRFGEMAKHMRSALTTEGLANLGYSAESANEHMAKYTSRLARSGVAQTMNAEQLTKASVDYLKNLDALSKLTGKSKDALEAEQDAMMNQAKFRALLQGKDKDTQDQLNRLLMSVPEGMRAGAMEVLATGTATTKAGQDYLAYMAQSGQSFIQTGQMVRNGGKLTAEATDSLIDATRDEAKAFAESPLGQTLAMFDDSLNEFMIGAFNLAAVTVNAKDTRIATENATNSTDKMAQELVTAKQRIAAFSTSIQESLIDMLPALTEALTKTLDFIEGPLKTTLKFLSDNMDSVGKAIAGALIAIAGVKTYRGVTGLMGMMGGGDQREQRGRRGKKGKGGGAGNALGGLAGGLLRGIATGLLAFANPKVLLGATNLAGVIVIIGGAIAGAAWLLGKSLPTLSEGLKTFEDLDGNKLAEVGKGMLLLGAGLAVFGVGGAAGSLGNAASNLIDGVNKFFGGKSPFEKLEEFSQMNINAERVKQNADAMIDFSAAMARVGGGTASAAAGNALDSFVSFFTGSAIEKLQKQILDFQNITFDRSRIAENASGLDSFVEAMSIVSNDAFVNSLNSLSRLSTGGMFSSSPLENLAKQVNEYQKLSVDRNKINTTAEGLRTFAHSMTEISSADLDISAALNLEPSIRGLRNINTQLESYITNLRNIKKELPAENQPGIMDRMFGRGGAEAAANTAPATMPGQDQEGQIVNSLNTKLDQLININSELADINRQQLTVQKGLTGNLYESF
jgi:hypothetical protein